LMVELGGRLIPYLAAVKAPEGIRHEDQTTQSLIS